jgi:hypothetical protein
MDDNAMANPGKQGLQRCHSDFFVSRVVVRSGHACLTLDVRSADTFQGS